MRSELVAYIGPEDTVARAALMALPRQRSWGSVVEDFVGHKDRKNTFDAEGQAVRRHVLARKRSLVGLGKEANRVEDSRVVGLRVAGGRAKTYVDPDPFKGSVTEVAKRLGVSRRTVFYRRNDGPGWSGPRRGRRPPPREESSIRGAWEQLEMKSPAKRPPKAQPKALAPKATYVEDMGAVYDAPLEVVWDFMGDETFHPKAHTAAVRNFEEKALSTVTSLLTYERRKKGRWEKMACRMTVIRPAVRIQEDLDGPYAGSKTVFLYTPVGERTVVDVFAYVQSSELTPAEIKRDRKKTWANAYSEDLPYFHRFAEQHPAVQTKRR